MQNIVGANIFQKQHEHVYFDIMAPTLQQLAHRQLFKTNPLGIQPLARCLNLFGGVVWYFWSIESRSVFPYNFSHFD